MGRRVGGEVFSQQNSTESSKRLQLGAKPRPNGSKKGAGKTFASLPPPFLSSSEKTPAEMPTVPRLAAQTAAKTQRPADPPPGGRGARGPGGSGARGVEARSRREGAGRTGRASPARREGKQAEGQGRKQPPRARARASPATWDAKQLSHAVPPGPAAGISEAPRAGESPASSGRDAGRRGGARGGRQGPGRRVTWPGRLT